MTQTQPIFLPKQIIIDTDMGHDDAFAVLLALSSKTLKVLGLSVVAGNIPAAGAAINARRIVELAGRPEMEVRIGATIPLLRPSRHAHEIHGKTGIDGFDWPDPRFPALEENAIDWMIRTIRSAASQTITIIALGPLTNLALALRLAPDIAERIEKIVIMGGGYFEGGNMTPAAEFNILVDPDAAAIVFGAGITMVAMPLDCTLGAGMPTNWRSRMIELGTQTGLACAGMIEFFERHGNRKYGTSTRPLHDALAVAWVLWPELFDGKLCNVEIETASPLTMGMTVVDWWQTSDRPQNCLWLRNCDRETIYQRMLDHIATLP